jgi:hypothetical protein
MTASGIYQVIARRGRECGIEVFPHRFRHHFSHTWLDRGGAEGDLMELNGWTSPQMLRRYGTFYAWCTVHWPKSVPVAWRRQLEGEMAPDLFAGMLVTGHAAALPWYERGSSAGSPPSCRTTLRRYKGWRLLAQGLTRLYLAGLVPFGLGQLAGCGQDFSCLIGRDEHDAVVVA